MKRSVQVAASRLASSIKRRCGLHDWTGRGALADVLRAEDRNHREVARFIDACERRA